MANIIETPISYPNGIYQIENGDPATGGVNGIAVLPHKQQTLRTAYLKSHVDALETLVSELAWLGPELPIGALPYPTIFTAGNKVSLSAASGANGGTVSLSTCKIALAKEIVTGVSGRLGLWTCPALGPVPLAINKTYYLRFNIKNGVFDTYISEGTDTDSIPASLRATGGDSACGFDTTRIDILAAKIVTAGAGSVPTVTTLANAEMLTANGATVETFTRTTSAGRLIGFQQTSKTLNWSRVPVLSSLWMTAQKASVGGGIEQFFIYTTGTVTDGTGTLTAHCDRYQLQPFGSATLTATQTVTIDTQLRWALLA